MSLKQQFRPPTTAEAEVIQRLVATDFPGRKEIADQLRSYGVRTIDDEGSLALEVIGNAVPAKAEKRIPVESEAPDADGIHVHFLLHVINGIAAELEIYKDDSTRIMRMPRADELDVFVLGK